MGLVTLDSSSNLLKNINRLVFLQSVIKGNAAYIELLDVLPKSGDI